jgi:hypothetical protein
MLKKSQKVVKDNRQNGSRKKISGFDTVHRLSERKRVETDWPMKNPVRFDIL